MDLRGKCEHLPLKRLYYGLFLGLIAIPLFFGIYYRIAGIKSAV